MYLLVSKCNARPFNIDLGGVTTHIYIYTLIPYVEPVSLGIWGSGVQACGAPWNLGFRDLGPCAWVSETSLDWGLGNLQNKYADRQGFLSEIQRHSARTWSLDVGVYL